MKADYDEHQNPRITMDVKMFKEGEWYECDRKTLCIQAH